MPVQLNKAAFGSSFPLTSPPVKYELPSNEWIASEINFTDRSVRLTFPFPDMVDIIAPVSEHTQCFPDGSWKPALQKASQLDHEIKEHLKAFPAAEGLKLDKLWPPHDPRHAVVRLVSGDKHIAYVELRRTKKEGFPSWSIRIEFNPSRLGYSGLAELRAKFEDAFGMLSLGKILREGKLSRLDVAVDAFGVLPIDLIVRVKKPGNYLSYSSQDGALETRMFFGEKLPSPKPMKSPGPLRLKIYDKLAEAKAKGKKPDSPGIRRTRLETSRRWKSHRPTLAQLHNINNPFKGVEVAYAAPDHLIGSECWRRVVEGALLRGISHIPVPSPASKGLKLIATYKKIAADILSAKSWDGWQQGVALTGFSGWIIETCEDDYPSQPFHFE